MGRKPKQQRSAEEKLAIVMEGLKSGNIAETCRKFEIAPNLFYRWKDEVEKGALAELGGRSAAARPEEIWLNEYRSLEEAKQSIGCWIEEYNHDRLTGRSTTKLHAKPGRAFSLSRPLSPAAATSFAEPSIRRTIRARGVLRQNVKRPIVGCFHRPRVMMSGQLVRVSGGLERPIVSRSWHSGHRSSLG
jgi:transposase-like protein